MKNWMKFSVFLIPTFFAFTNSEGQNSTVPQLKVVSPPSPNAASIGKYGDYPVSLYNGLVNISIPIYEIKAGDLNLPISLNYHSSGIKVTDVASWAGLGWSLNAGGVISRSIMGGIADETTNGYLSVNNVIKGNGQLANWRTSQANIDYFLDIQQQNIDGEPDVFSYNLPGKSGKFLFNRDKTSLIKIPLDKTKITTDFPNNLITIVDDNGITYRFGKALDGTNCYELSQTYDPNSAVVNNVTSSWLLTAIISADKSDTITFKYSKKYLPGWTDWMDSYTIKDQHFTYENGDPLQWAFQSDFGFGSSSSVNISTEELKLREITYRNGKIIIDTSVDNRLDRTGDKKLRKIIVYRYDHVTSTFKVIKSIQLFHSYYNNNDRLKLDSVKVLDASDAGMGTYKFSYNTTMLPAYTSRKRDFWGYYNNNLGATLVPRVQIPYTGDNGGGPATVWIGDANREPDTVNMKACILEKIVYPTGGSTEFKYETNKYQVGTTTYFAGGLRIRQIISYDSVTGTPIITTYKYGQNESGIGLLNTPSNLPDPVHNTAAFSTSVISQNWGTHQYQTSSCPESIRARSFSTNLNIDVIPYDGSPVYYDYVTEYKGEPSSALGKTVYNYQFFSDVNSYYVQHSVNRVYRQTYHWKRGYLKQKSVYNNTGSLISQLENSYSVLDNQNYDSVGILLNRNYQYVGNSASASESPNDPNINGSTLTCGYGMYLFDYASYKVETGVFLLTSSTEKTYDLDNTSNFVTKTTSYTYNIGNYQPLKITEALSDGDNKVTQIKYPVDYNLGGSNLDNTAKGILNLKNSNILITPVETYNQLTNSSNGNVRTTAAMLTTFKTVKPYLDSIFQIELTAPITDFTVSNVSGNNFTKDSRYKTAIAFPRYDSRGNLIQQSKVGDMQHSYLYDYNNAFLIAEVKNADSSSIAYTSFEADGKGNWTFNGSISTVTTGGLPPTGNKYYNLTTTNQLTKATVIGKKYIVSYWSKSGSFSVTGSTNTITGKTIDGWTYFEHEVTATGVTLSISGTGQIDEVRLYPADAQMTTYTHQVMVGPTSVCDLNNRITYYRYDTYGRLSYISDQDKFIIKKFCYNYDGQPVNCDIAPESSGGDNITVTVSNTSGASGFTVVYTNVVTSQFFPINNINGAGPFTRTVPAGIYNISVTRSGGNTGYSFTTCSPGITTNCGTTLSNVNISATTCNAIQISSNLE